MMWSIAIKWRWTWATETAAPQLTQPQKWIVIRRRASSKLARRLRTIWYFLVGNLEGLMLFNWMKIYKKRSAWSCRSWTRKREIWKKLKYSHSIRNLLRQVTHKKYPKRHRPTRYATSASQMRRTSARETMMNIFKWSEMRRVPTLRLRVEQTKPWTCSLRKSRMKATI